MNRRRLSLSRSRGFTLVELMISLVAGVVVAMSVVGLAKSATNTFHEQVRLSSTEASVRTSSERLRNDLIRIGFMGTGNIKLDPKVARLAGATSGYGHDTNFANLQGIHIEVAAGAAAAGNPLENGQAMFPDRIYIGGNLTTDDSYRGQLKGEAPSCGAVRITLDRASDAAVDRLMSNGGFSNAFVPVVAGGVTYGARVLDPRGCFHYVEVCAAGAISATQAFVDLKNGTGGKTILSTADTGNDVCGANVMEEVTVSPYQVALWSVVANTNAQIDTDTTIDGAKFNLQREYFDPAAGAVVANSAEIVAEYAIDLKFGLVLQTPASNAVTVYDLDSDAGGGSGVIDTATKAASATVAGTLGPQNVKSVRYRLSTRSSVPDRSSNFAAPGAYLSRYCTQVAALPLPATTCKSWARVRSIVSEVALINQARMFY